MGFLRRASRELKTFLSSPYYVINTVLSLSFLALRLLPPFCTTLFTDCELDMRENEILFFLLVVVMIRSRKTGSTVSMISYFSNAFVYAKVANLILFFRSDPRFGLTFLLVFIFQAILLPEPSYKGPANIVYFRTKNALSEELARDPKVTWLVTFYAAWSPSSVTFGPTFSKLSNDYGLLNLKFGKIDCGRFPEVAATYHVNTSALTTQLPTIIMFQDGKEVGRVPSIISGKVQKFLFREEDIVNVFDLNNLFQGCKKDKRYIAKKSVETESKKDN